MLALPRADASRAFGGCPCFAGLLEIRNEGAEALRLEMRASDAEAWETLVPRIAPGESWAARRSTPLWIPRVAAVRLVRAADGAEVMLRSPWGDGGALTVPRDQ